jgi:hypothetical protein
VIDGGPFTVDGEVFTVRLNCLDALPKALVAVMVTVATLIAVGVPAMTPVDGFRVRPAGSAPLITVHVMGVLPEAARVVE